MSDSTQVHTAKMRGVTAAAAGRAARLDERFGPAWQPEHNLVPTPRSHELMGRWSTMVVDGDRSRLGDHLDRLGVACVERDEQEIARRLGPGRQQGNRPGWLAVADHVIEHAHELSSERTPNEYAPHPQAPTLDDAVPFVGVYRPFLAVAVAQLTERVPSRLLTQEVRADLGDWLVRRLGTIWGETLEREFEAERRSRGWALSPGLTLAVSSYEGFVRRVLGNGLLVEDYPVLMRLSVTVMQQWVDNAADLLARLELDRPSLAAELNGGEPLGAVRSISAGTSDAHRGGRTVHILTFASGRRVVYKPRDLGAEAATNDLLRWLGARHPVYDFTPLTVVVRDGYGWEEFVQTAPTTVVEGSADVGPARFFRRAGALLAVLHALGATDIHRENLIAVGDRPVLVDAETVMHPRLMGLGTTHKADGAAAAAVERLHASVLATQLLPGWQLSAGGEAFDTAGLSGLDGREPSFPVARWKAVNTDAMTREIITMTAVPGDNVVRLAAGPVAPALHREDLAAGFRETYAQLVRDRTAMLAPGGPLAAFAGCRVRMIVRPTASYGLIAISARRGDASRDGAARGIALDRLSKYLYACGSPASLWPLYHAEIAALEQLDVPHFTVRAGSTRVELPDGTLSPACLRETPWQVLCDGLQALGPADLELQERLLRGSFDSRYGDDARSDHVEDVPCPVGSAFDLEEAIARAEALGQRLLDNCVRGRDGGLAWIGATLLGPETSQVDVTSHDLYGGASGIALFLAALAHASGDSSWAEAAGATLTDLRYAIATEPRQLVLRLGAGAGYGTGSVLYGLTALSGLLDDPSLLADATTVALAVDERLITSPHQGDIMSGTAGLALGLLALHRRTRNVEVLDRARRCGDQLLTAAIEPTRGTLAWPSFAGVPLTSLAHGSAGAALSLARLFEATGDDRYADAVRRACAFEESMFSPDHGTWPDLRPSAVDPYGRSGWCFGAAGIGMGRPGLRGILDDERIRTDVERAVAVSADPRPGVRDSLCCGSLGRAVFLLEAGDQLGRYALTAAGEHLVAAVARRADQAHGYRLDDGATARLDSPGLFRGAAGAGYALLLLHHRRQLPQPLTWE